MTLSIRLELLYRLASTRWAEKSGNSAVRADKSAAAEKRKDIALSLPRFSRFIGELPAVAADGLFFPPARRKHDTAGEIQLEAPISPRGGLPFFPRDTPLYLHNSRQKVRATAAVAVVAAVVGIFEFNRIVCIMKPRKFLAGKE